MSVNEFETVASIAARKGVSAWAVERAVRRKNIRPAKRLGTIRLYDGAGVAAIEEELERTQSRRRRMELVGA